MAKKFTVDVEFTHTWTSTEEIQVTVIADDEDEALTLAKREASDESEPCKYEADINESYISGTKIAFEDELPFDYVPRCTLTADMFTPPKGAHA